MSEYAIVSSVILTGAEYERLTARVKELEEGLGKLTARLYEDLDGGRKLRRAEVDKARALLSPAPEKGGEG